MTHKYIKVWQGQEAKGECLLPRPLPAQAVSSITPACVDRIFFFLSSENIEKKVRCGIDHRL